jgi:ABC-type Mn2+/Zn2+ transport system permease subunit
MKLMYSEVVAVAGLIVSYHCSTPDDKTAAIGVFLFAFVVARILERSFGVNPDE